METQSAASLSPCSFQGESLTVFRLQEELERTQLQNHRFREIIRQLSMELLSQSPGNRLNTMRQDGVSGVDKLIEDM